MQVLSETGPLNHESEIHWTESPDQFDYVRERMATAGTRGRPVPWEGKSQGAGRMVGYAILDDDAPSVSAGRFRRRVFVVCEHDRSEPGEGPYDDGSAPVQGIDPSTVEPGVPGTQTPQARGEA